MREVHIVAAAAQDWQAFLDQAVSEGWRVPQSEIAFHCRPASRSVYALRRAEATIGFVTAVAHQRSGWIGNLLIPPAQRGQGYGARLFDAALLHLRQGGVDSIWLTASAQGESLYRRRGFRACGRVRRWLRSSGGEGAAALFLSTPETGRRADREVWQESRQELLAHISTANLWLARGGSIALLQAGEEQQILGPWFNLSDTQAPWPLLETVVACAAPGKELVIDALDHPGTSEKLRGAGFACSGENLLMALGPIEDLRLDRLYALASLGSIG